MSEATTVRGVAAAVRSGAQSAVELTAATLRSIAAAESGERRLNFQAGEKRLLDYFVGQVMRLSGERADPQRVAERLRTRPQQRAATQ